MKFKRDKANANAKMRKQNKQLGLKGCAKTRSDLEPKKSTQQVRLTGCAKTQLDQKLEKQTKPIRPTGGAQKPSHIGRHRNKTSNKTHGRGPKTKSYREAQKQN